MSFSDNGFSPQNEMPSASGPPVSAVIDIGTNTVLLLAGYRQANRIVVLDEAQEIPRIGKGVDAGGVISEAAIGRLLEALTAHKKRLSAAFGEISVYVSATSAMRDAANRNEVLRRIHERLGWSVEVLHGNREAEAGFSGALSMLPQTVLLPGQSVSVIDIGGGSTELSFGRGAENNSPARLEHRFSLNAGAVRFTERYLDGIFSDDGNAAKRATLTHTGTTADPTTAEFIEKAILQMSQAFSEMVPRPVPSSDVLIGVAGTVTSLAYILSGASADYDARQLNGMMLTVDRVEAFMRQAQAMSADELTARWPVVMKGRADIFLAGIVILHTWMKLTSQTRLIVSTGGLRHGILLDEGLPGNLF